MLMKKLLLRATGTGMFLLFLAASSTSAQAQNVLTNPGFEAGFSSWTAFGNSYIEASNPPCIVPYAGNNVNKMFGGFAGGFSVSGTFQSYPAAPGEVWMLSCKSRHCADDPIRGLSLPKGGNGNWVVQKLIFRADGVNDIASNESVILDGDSPVDTWFNNAPVTLTAPPTTTTVWAFLLYLAPGNDGGAVQIDNVSLSKESATPVRTSTWGNIKKLYR